MNKYCVTVGNIGTVYEGHSSREAGRAFKEYKEQSRTGYGRAAFETVTLITQHGDAEHHPMATTIKEYVFDPRQIVPVVALSNLIWDEGQALKRNFSAEDLTEPGSDFVGTDCRLRIYGGDWELLTGSADFDTDHRGRITSSSIPRGCTRKEARAIAEDLLNQD